MEMEHINENTIRVLIRNEDLVERGITFLDLLGNYKQIENFFYSILEEVDIEEQFQETDAITFQVLPNRDGLELFISKNSNTDKGTMNFSDFVAEMDQEEVNSFVKNQLLGDSSETLSEENIEENMEELVFRLEDFENLVQLSKEIYLPNAQTTLYKMYGRYYLTVRFPKEETSEAQMQNDVAQILEFAAKTATTPEVLGEYGEVIMQRNALELTRFYFK